MLERGTRGMLTFVFVSVWLCNLRRTLRRTLHSFVRYRIRRHSLTTSWYPTPSTNHNVVVGAENFLFNRTSFASLLRSRSPFSFANNHHVFHWSLCCSIHFFNDRMAGIFRSFIGLFLESMTTRWSDTGIIFGTWKIQREQHSLLFIFGASKCEHWWTYYIYILIDY